MGNNPLSASDPSGYFSLKQLVKTVVGVVASVYLGPLIGGAIMGYLGTGDLKGALLGMIGGAMSFGIGEAFQGFSGFGALFSKSVLHGLSQGILSKAGGGRFGDGFLGGFAGSMASPLTRGIKGVDASAKAARIVTAAVIGGTTAKLGGGKFANGAISAAFVQAFNHEMHRGMQTSEDGVEAHANPEGAAADQAAAERAAARQEAFERNVVGRDKLDGLDPAFRPRAEQVLTDLAERGYRLRVVWGRRTQAENQLLVDQGVASPTSRHLDGQALDFVERSIGYDNANYPQYNAAVQQAAANAGLIWGGNFTTRWDPNHIEMP